jgi:hypothetical protein
MNAPTNVVGIREVAPAAPKPRARTKSPAPAAAARAERKAAVRANTQEVQAQRWSAGLLGGVAAVLTGLSLSHLAHGIEVITHPVYSWEPWAMGVGVDVGMIATEVASLTAGERVRRETRWYSVAMIAGTLVLSACMNAFAFSSQASTLPFQIAGVVFGIAVPSAIYVLMRQAAAHYLDAHKRS